MRLRKIDYIISASIAASLLIFLGFFGDTATNIIDGPIQRIRVSVYSKLSIAGSFISEIKKMSSLINENIKLKDENTALMAKLANQQNIEEQNIFLKESLNLDITSDWKLMDAGVFNFNATPRGNQISINRGRKDGVKEGDVIISSSGVLIGVIKDVYDNFSIATTITSLDFKTTISVLNKNISGIAKGALTTGLYIDFISQNDDISEQDIIITSGSDIYPAGLIVGEVSRINTGNDGLFKQVVVRPSANDINVNKVLIMTKP